MPLVYKAVCDFCGEPIPVGTSVMNFWCCEQRFCSEECADNEHDRRIREWLRREFSIQRHPNSRFWQVVDGNGDLVCLTVYKKGAEEVVRRLTEAWKHR